MPLILGLASSHDASACLLRDGEILAAVSQERVTRVKNDGYRLPLEALGHMLKTAGVTPREIDAVAAFHSFFPEKYFRRESPAKELGARVARISKRLRGEGERYLNVNDLLKRVSPGGESIDRYFRKNYFLKALDLRPGVPVAFYDHHATHAMAAAHYAGFGDCAVVTIDGVGELNIHHTASVVRAGRLQREDYSDTLGASPGEYYEAITEAMGFIALRHEGKVLGLAAHGDPGKLYPDFRRALRPTPDGRSFTSDFVGRPNAYQAREAYLESLVKGNPREDVAAAAQAVFEDTIVQVVRGYLRRTRQRRLALNGGVFANVKLNQRLAALAEVDDLFVFPAMGDSGNSVGAALLLHEQTHPGFLRQSTNPLRSVYWGSGWSAEECRAAIERAGFACERLDERALVKRSAEAVHAGRILGWFQGRMEFGPRALGNRSIVARPTEGSINQSLNERLSRTEFMPFAPSVLAEQAEGVFENVPKSARCLPFMTITCQVRPEWKARIPAVVHVDGTARPQTVARDVNPLYWSLIDAYRALSGIPLVLNTSFNVHEEPIVCFPANAVQALIEGRIDCLALGPWWVERR